MQQMQSCPFAALLQASGLSTCSGVSTPTLTNSASQLTSSATVAVPDAALPRSRYLMQSVNTPRGLFNFPQLLHILKVILFPTQFCLQSLLTILIIAT